MTPETLNDMINIAELLKGATKGMTLYSLLHGKVEFAEVMDTDYVPIRVMKHGNGLRFDEYGRYMGNEYPDSECVLFPSKDCRTWQGWTPRVEPKFKVGDWIVRGEGFVYEPSLITEIRDYYICELPNGERVTYTLNDVHKNFHLWTIADAKDGDVLAKNWHEDDDSWEKIVIFKKYHANGVKGLYNRPCVEGYGNTFKNGKLAFIEAVPYYSKTWTDELHPVTKEQRGRLFQKMKEAGYQWDYDKKELKKIIKPKFKVGDWIAYNEDKSSIAPMQIIRITEDEKYIVSGHWSYDFRTLETDWHLWTIEDAKDGDVLCTYENGNPKIVFILRGNPDGNCTVLNYYCYYNIMYPRFEPNAEMGCLAPKRENVKPATREQRDLLFAKMREAGYEWDADKKELKKIQSHYDIANFHAGMPVLVRPDNDCAWDYSIFSRITDNEYWKFSVCNGVSFTQCIPLNEKTKHLLGTADMPSEEFINW